MKQIDQNTAVGSILKEVVSSWISSGKQARKEYLETRSAIKFYGYDQDGNIPEQRWSERCDFSVKTTKSSEAVELFVPRIVGQDPARVVRPKPWASERSSARSELIQKYLNYTPKELDLYSHNRRMVREAVLGGRGVLWTGLHPTKDIVGSFYLPTEDILVDSDARNTNEIAWISRAVYSTSRFLEKKYKKNAERIRGLPKVTRNSEAEVGSNDTDKGNTGSNLKLLWHIYLKTSLENYITTAQSKALGNLASGPVKLVADDTGFVYEVCAWEVPFHEDDEFPCTFFDPRESPDSIWPQSPLQPGLPWQRLMTYIAKKSMARFTFASELSLAVCGLGGEKLSDKALETLFDSWGGVSAFKIDAPNLPPELVDVRRFVQEVNISTRLNEFTAAYEFCNRMYEYATGQNEFLYAGETSHQMRSAKEAELRQQNSTSRIEDMREIFERTQGKVTRKEALAARFLLDPGDISRLFGPESGKLWGVLMPMEYTDPGFHAVKIRESYKENDEIPPEQDIIDLMAGQEAESWSSNGITLDEWRLEIDYDIEAGSTARRDPNFEAQASADAMNQLVPTLLQVNASGMPVPAALEAAFEFIAIYADKNLGADKTVLDKLRGTPAQILLQTQQLMQQQQAAQQQPQAAPPPY